MLMGFSQNANSSNQLFSTLSLTRLCILKAVGNLYDAFSVHKKGQSPPPKTLPQAVEKVRFSKEIFTE